MKNITKYIQVLWRKHYIVGITGSFHGDMAYAFAAILKDSDCDTKVYRQIWISIRRHLAIESHKLYHQRRWFTERFSGKWKKNINNG